MYHRVAKFEDRQQSSRCYMRVQAAIQADPEAELSAYNIWAEGERYVVVLGDPPSEDTDSEIEGILVEEGVPAFLPPGVLAALAKRRAAGLKLGVPWREGHYKPGIGVPYDNESG